MEIGYFGVKWQRQAQSLHGLVELVIGTEKILQIQ
jgi:hypothetical protein